MIRVVIIDDEDAARNFIEKILVSNFKDIDVVAQASNVESGINTINKYSPDIVFLDIDMPDGTGFDLLQQLQKIDFKLIFVTAHSQHALKAIKFSALDYILKPVDILELVQTVKKALNIIEKETEQIKIKTFLSNISNLNGNKKIVLKTSDNIYVINVKNIIRCLSESNYTTLYINDKRKIVISKTLKEYENLLCEFGFIRIHRSHLININYIERYSKDNSILHMKDNSQIPVSHRKKDQLIQILENL